jgi:hypothetical protein
VTRFGHSNGLARLEALLRREQPRPPAALEERLTIFIENQPRRGVVRPRVALATAFSVATLAALGSLVGVSQAASGPQQVVAAVVHVISVSTSSAGKNDKGGKDEKGGGGKDDKGGGKGGDDHGGGKGGDDHGGGGGNGHHDDDDDPSHDQYKPGKGCGDDNHVHSRENECKDKKDEKKDDKRDDKKR